MPTLLTNSFLPHLQNGHVADLAQARLTYGLSDYDFAQGKAIIRTGGDGRYEIEMTASTFDLSHVLTALNGPKNHPLDTREWPKLRGSDQVGRQWVATLGDADIVSELVEGSARTLRIVATSKNLSGLLSSDDSNSTLNPVARVEMVFDLSKRRWLADAIGSLTERPTVIETPLTTIWFEFDFNTNLLRASALYTSDRGQPYLDSWVFEPLLILLGTAIEPVIAVRVPSSCDWATQIFLRPDNASADDQDDISTGLWGLADHPNDSNLFWNWYKCLFMYLAERRDKAGHRAYDIMDLTWYHRQVQVASISTLWLRSAAYSAVIEGLAQIAIPEQTVELDKDTEVALGIYEDRLEKLIEELRDNGSPTTINRVHKSLTTSLDRFRSFSTRGRLLSLIDKGVLKKSHERAWSKVRNKVLHGNLGEIYSTPKGNQDTALMMDCVARLTCHIAGIDTADLSNRVHDDPW